VCLQVLLEILHAAQEIHGLSKAQTRLTTLLERDAFKDAIVLARESTEKLIRSACPLPNCRGCMPACVPTVRAVGWVPHKSLDRAVLTHTPDTMPTVCAHRLVGRVTRYSERGFAVVEDLASDLQDTYMQIEEHLDRALATCCRSFEKEKYAPFPPSPPMRCEHPSTQRCRRTRPWSPSMRG
jgi:hypothetical protein